MAYKPRVCYLKEKYPVAFEKGSSYAKREDVLLSSLAICRKVHRGFHEKSKRNREYRESRHAAFYGALTSHIERCSEMLTFMVHVLGVTKTPGPSPQLIDKIAHSIVKTLKSEHIRDPLPDQRLIAHIPMIGRID
jgi:hypothetical protein